MMGTIPTSDMLIHIDPWKSTDTGKTFFFDVDMTDPENQKPAQQLEGTENIKVHIVPLKNLRENVLSLAKEKGYQLETMLMGFVAGYSCYSRYLGGS